VSAIPEGVEFRTGRRGLVVSLPLLAVVAAVGIGSTLPWTMLSATLLLFVVGGVSGAAVSAALFGRTRVSDGGIANRRWLVEEDVPWADVAAIEVRADPGRRVVLTRRSGQRVELAGPREGLCTPTAEFEPAYRRLRTMAPEGIAAPDPPARGGYRWYVVDGACFGLVFVVVLALLSVYERPWNASWWPDRHEASSVPNACRESAAEARRFGFRRDEWDERAVGPGTGDRDRSFCSYRSAGGDTLTMSVEAHHWSGHGDSGTRLAHDRAVDEQREPARRRAAPVIGGDEVWLEVDSHAVVLRVRKANVLLVATHMGDSRTPNADAATAVIRAVLVRVRVG
jgi:hypothetical protein